MAFVPLHNHTEYSVLDGLSTPREVAERCAELGCPCCGITDHGNVAGHLEFGKALAKHGIKPIYGCELYHGVKDGTGGWARNERDQAHFVAGAMTDEGLRNLWRLVDSASRNFRYVGRVNWDSLERYSEGLFATSACIQGLVPQGVKQGDLTALDRYLNIFGDNFFIELHTYPADDQEQMNLWLVDVAQERGIPVVYANDAHFASPEQYEFHDAYVAMQTGQTIDTPLDERKMWHPKALYMMGEDEIRSHLSYLPEGVVDEALSNTAMIAEKCNAELPAVKRHLPAFIPKECPWIKNGQLEKSAATLFLDLVETGLINRYGVDAPDEVWDRAEREMEVFLGAGLEHYFLQAWDFCKFCDENLIKRGPGRGSAAGAIVAYALGVTDIDPLHYNLIFERFFNPGREKGFPDIDNDFPQAKRKVVREYLKNRWGQENVRTIGTITRLKPKAVCDKTYQACGISWGEKEAVKKIVGETPDIDILGPDSIGWSEGTDPGKTIYVMDHVGKDIAKWITDQPQDRHDLLWRWIEFCDTICSRVSGFGVHPSGVVVADCDLSEELPAFWSSSQEEAATMFPMNDVDARMFVKQDLLGLRTLDTLEEWEGLVKDRTSVEWSGLEFREEFPDEMWELLDNGLSLGIFQIEDGYARKLCEQFKPRSIEDLSIIVALNRPGPIRSGAPDSFIRRRFGLEPVSYDAPMLESILEPTYGWFLYQEQVIAFFSKLGYNLSEADAVRKILGKKRPEDMQKLKNGQGEWEGRGYIDMAVAAGVTADTAFTIWDKLEDFAKYSFNKSHSVAYATIAFRTLWAKWMHPAEFIMALIRTNSDMSGAYVAEGRRMGIVVSPPDILLSDVDVELVDGNIYFGLSNVKGVGKGSAQYVLKLRKKWGEAIQTPDGLQSVLDAEGEEWQQHKTGRSPRQLLGSNKVEALYNAGAFDNYEPRSMTMADRQKMEKEYLGVIVTDNTEQVFSNNSDVIADCDTYEELLDSDSLVVCQLPGVVTTVKETKTKAAGKAMGIVTIEYEGREVQFVVFPQDWTKYKFLWRERTPGIFTVAKTDRGYSFKEGWKLS